MLSNKSLKTYVEETKPFLVGHYIGKPILYSKGVILFHLSGKEYRRLTFILDIPEPRFYLSSDFLESSTSDSHFMALLRKYCSNAYVVDVSLLNDDRIVVFDLKRINDVFKEEPISLVFEMLPRQPNLIVLDADKKVLATFRSHGPLEKRPLMNGLLYEAPEPSINSKEDDHFSKEKYLHECSLVDESLGGRRKRERYSSLFTHLKSRKKALERKIAALEQEKEDALAHLEDGKKADAIYTCLSDLKEGQESFEYEGLTVKLDPRKSLVKNAQSYYKSATKAKRKLVESDKHLATAKDDLEKVIDANNVLASCSLEGLELLQKELGFLPNEPGFARKKSQNKLQSLAHLPREIIYKDTRILFGRDSKENDNLTFLLETAKNHLFFHIMGDHGAHVIIKKDNPSQDEIDMACYVALLASKRKDGEVMMALRKDVKKGSSSGQAVVKNFKTIRINEIPKKAVNLYETATKMKF